MPTVQYRFVATGHDSVASAFKGILAMAQQTSKGVAAAVQQTERVARVASGATRGATDATERAAKKAADAKAREEQKSLAYVARIRERHFAEQQKQEERAAARKAREDQRNAAHVAGIKQRYFEEQQRKEEKMERANARIRDARIKTVVGISKDAALAGVGFGASLLGVVGQAAREGVQLQDISTRLSVNARGAGEKGVDPTVLRREFEAAALANPGVKATDVAAGAAGFVAKTGELGVARRFSSTFATVASASGASVEDISNAAADLFQKFDITSIEDMRSALAALTFQGKAGAFEIKDAAAQFAKMSAAASRFGVTKGAEGVKILGGLTQIARSATGSPEQAATAVEATFRQLVSKSKEIQGMGVHVFEKGSKSKTRDVRDVLTETIAKSKGSLPKLQEIFGDEGIRGISPLISAFNEAKGKATGTEAEKTAAGMAAIREALAKAIDAPGDWSEVVKDAAAAQKSASAQLDAAWESVKAAVAQDAVPALLKLAPAMTSLAETAIGPAIVVFTALVEAAGDVVDVFKTIGLLKEKQVTPEQKLKTAKEALANFDKAQGIGAPTAEKAAERARLAAAVDAAEKGVYNTVTLGKGDNKPLTADEFAKRYVEAANPVDLEDKDKRDAIDAKAKALAGSLARDPRDTFASNDWLQGISGENDAQKRIRQQYQGDVEAGGSAEMKAAAAETKAAAQLLKSAALGLSDGKPRGGSIVAD